MKLPRDINVWPAELYELLQERIAIMIEDGKLSESAAKREAEQDIRRIAEREIGPQQERLKV